MTVGDLQQHLKGAIISAEQAAAVVAALGVLVH